MDEYEKLINAERARQLEKWGVQNHDFPLWSLILIEEVGEFAKAILEGENMSDIKNELIQIAAVCKAIYEDKFGG